MEFLQEAEFWVSVGIVILIVAVYKPLKRSFTTALDTRAARIKTELDEAARLREEAAALLAQYQAKQREALAEAQEILHHAAEEAERNRRRAESDLEASLRRREQQAVDRIAQAEVKAIDEVRMLAVDLAMAATSRLLRDRLDEARAGKLIDQAIAELPEKLH